MILTKRGKKWFGWMLYGLFLMTVCEIALRVYLVYFADPFRFEIYSSKSMVENRFEEPVVIPHTFLGYANSTKFGRGDDKHNNLGFRGEEVLKPKPEGAMRIVCIGGSTTYSTGVKNFKESYPFLLQEALRSGGIDAEVINAGVEGYNSLQSYINYLLKVEELEPDLLIIYHAFNDVSTRMVWPPEAYVADQSGFHRPVGYTDYNFLRKLSIIRVPLVYSGLIAPDVALSFALEHLDTNYFLEIKEQLLNDTYPSGIFETVSLDSMIKTNEPVFFKKNLDRLINLAKSNGTQVVLSTFIFSDMFPDQLPELGTPAFQKGIDEHNEILRELSRKHNVPLLDLEREMVVTEEWFTDGMHFNLLGNQKRVEKITEFLVPIMKDSPTGKTDN